MDSFEFLDAGFSSVCLFACRVGGHRYCTRVKTTEAHRLKKRGSKWSDFKSTGLQMTNLQMVSGYCLFSNCMHISRYLPVSSPQLS